METGVDRVGLGEEVVEVRPADVADAHGAIGIGGSFSAFELHMNAKVRHSLVVACLYLNIRPVVVAIFLLNNEESAGIDCRLECRFGSLSRVMSAGALRKIVKKAHGLTRIVIAFWSYTGGFYCKSRGKPIGDARGPCRSIKHINPPSGS